VLAGILKVFRDMRQGAFDEHQREAQLASRCLMYRFFGRFMRAIDHTWQLFSGGMMLFDTLDGWFMNVAYRWVFARPVRKVYYNLVITGVSIGAAFLIGSIEILGVLTSEAHLRGRFWSFMANFNINLAGFCIAGLFIVVWAGALLFWRLGNVESRWSSDLGVAPTGIGPGDEVER